MLKARILSALLIGCLGLNTASARAEEPSDIALDPRYPTPEFSAEEARELGRIMCGSISSPLPSEKRKPQTILEDVIIRFSGWNIGNLDRDEIKLPVRTLWNTYEEHFICTDSLARQETGHILKRIVQLRLNVPLLNEHFLAADNNPIPVNLNFVETVERDGVLVKETLVDYIDHMLNRPAKYSDWFGREQTEEIQILRDEILIDEFGAKRASELE